MNYEAISALSLTCVGSWLAVAYVTQYARRRLVDTPNERSSHTEPTPRGGGVGLVLTHVFGLIAACALGVMTVQLAIAIVGGGSLVAFIGFLDDHKHVPASRRLACHLLACGWVVYWLGALDSGVGWIVLAVLCLTWFLNLFNFMDGIDGLAGVQAISMSAAAAILLYTGGHDSEFVWPLASLAASSLGFLVWNWPPARIFLGDVGSGYIGFAIGALALGTVVNRQLSVWVWLILGGAFIADASVTLMRRVARRERVHEAHRSHSYQRLSRHWGSHRSVTLLFLVVNLLWLTPLAALAAAYPMRGPALAAIAWIPLIFGALLAGSGRPGDIGRSVVG